jgi:hypothetical protein
MLNVRREARNQTLKESPLTSNYARLARQICQRLKKASINLGMVRLQLHVGLVNDAVANLASVHEEIQILRLWLGGKRPESRKHTRSAIKASAETHNLDDDRALLAECLG